MRSIDYVSCWENKHVSKQVLLLDALGSHSSLDHMFQDDHPTPDPRLPQMYAPLGLVQTLRDDLKLKMKDVEAKKKGTEVLLEEMGAQRSEAEAQQV